MISTLSFIDRFVINILAEDIKLDLRLTDTELGLVSGFAFSLAYALIIIPGARFADRTHRPRLLAGAVFVWSIFTVLCGYAGSFIQLVLARIGVGIGESSGAPIPQSLVADIVPLSRRAWAMGYVVIGAPLGSMIGMGIGGIIVDHVGWRTTLLLVGLPGFLLAGLMLLVREPRDAEKLNSAPPRPAPFWPLMKQFASKPSLLWMMAASALGNMVQMGRYAFVASFFLRVWKEDLVTWGHYFDRSWSCRPGLSF
jgi:predicted MFS family arabinose efflux permease